MSTQVFKYRFTVKEGQPSTSGADDAPAWLMLEPETGDLDIAKTGFLSLRLQPGTTVDQAADLARLLNRQVAGVGFTKL